MSGLPPPQRILDAYAEAMKGAGNEGALPELVAHTCKGTVVMVLGYDDGSRGVGPMLAAALDRLVAEHGSPEWLICTAETWMEEHVSDQARPAPGSYQNRARAGDPAIYESVFSVGYAASGDAWSVSRRFHRSPLGIVWDEPLQIFPGGGTVVDLVQRAVR